MRSHAQQVWVLEMLISGKLGLNENHNGLLCQFFPKKTNLLKVRQDEVNETV